MAKKKSAKKKTDKRRIKWEVPVEVGKKKYIVRLVLVGEIDRSLKLSEKQLEKIRSAFLSQYGYRNISMDQFKLFEVTKK